MNGPGQVTLAGKTDKLDAQLSGSGELHARQLWAGQAEVVVHDPGSAMVNVKTADKSRQRRARTRQLKTIGDVTQLNSA